jgi:hypothetical protein
MVRVHCGMLWMGVLPALAVVWIRERRGRLNQGLVARDGRPRARGAYWAGQALGTAMQLGKHGHPSS